nr:MAG TPA: Honey bee toxin [Caudoviricetes sp.]
MLNIQKKYLTFLFFSIILIMSQRGQERKF